MFGIFPGQGSQKSGMGVRFLKNNFIASIVNSASEIAKIDIKHLLTEADDAELSKTENAQIAIFTINYALAKFAQCSLEFSMLAGHSLGEYVALTLAEVFSFYDAVCFVKARGEIMSRVKNGSMIAFLGGIEDAVALCSLASNPDSFCCVANYNSSSQVVISGDNEAIERACEIARSMGKKAIKLSTSGPFHSPFLDYAVCLLRDSLDGVKISQPKIPVISNIYASEISNWNETIPLHCKAMVRWKETLEKSKNLPIIEIGAATVLKNMAAKDGYDVKYMDSFDCFREFFL
jgi:[acyl-carrier-protein] S-malonyltransferase